MKEAPLERNFRVDESGLITGPSFHDGFFSGVLINRCNDLILHVATQAGAPFRIVLANVSLMNVTNFWGGAIIGEVWLVPARSAFPMWWESLLRGRESSAGYFQKMSADRSFFVLECSYGGEVYAICDDIKILRAEDLA